MLDGHGDDLYKYQGQIKHNFSSNVYYQGCPKPLLDTLADSIHNIENYPSPSAQELNTLAAAKFDLSPNQFLFTNGATEAFYMIAQKHYGTSATIVGPTFSEYQDACTYSNIDTTFIPYLSVAKHQFNTALAFICNPNNPDGASLTLTTINHILSNAPNTTFVIDEAYIEFSNSTPTTVGLLADYNNLIIVKSLTKTFCIPGVRLGYIITNTSMIEKLTKFKMPWSVNSIAIAAGQFIFNHYQELLFDVRELIQKTDHFVQSFNQFSWLETQPSHTTFFLVKLSQQKVSDLKDYLVKKHQILVRDATNFIGLEGQYMRVSLQSETANLALIEALKQWN